MYRCNVFNVSIQVRLVHSNYLVTFLKGIPRTRPLSGEHDLAATSCFSSFTMLNAGSMITCGTCIHNHISTTSSWRETRKRIRHLTHNPPVYSVYYVGSTYVMEYGGIDDFDRILIRSIMYIWMWSTPIWTLGADYISHFFLLFYMSARFIPDVRRLDYNQNRFFCLFCTRALISSLLHPCLLWYLLHLGILHKIIRSILIG